jgi:tetrahydromethanopterin S-methyltransferase F subunit
MAEEISIVASAVPPESTYMPVIEETCYKAQLVSRNQKMSSAVGASRAIGFIIGMGFAIAMVLIPVALMGGI